jgi:uncharacterized cupredoxin-like copper-binding protein
MGYGGPFVRSSRFSRLPKNGAHPSQIWMMTISREDFMKAFRLMLLFSVFVLMLAACGGPAAPLTPVSYTIDMTEFAFNPNSLNLKVGQQVTLELTNSGQLVHEIMFGREVMRMNNRPSGYQRDLFETGGVEPEVNIVDEGQMNNGMVEEGHEGFMVVLGPGGRATMTFAVTEAMVGEWEMGCFEQDGVHYDAGMVGPVSITR